MPTRTDNSPAAEREYAVLHFPSTHDTMAAEKVAARSGYRAEVIPRPPGLTGRCGVALQVTAADLDGLAAALEMEGLADYDVVRSH
ncbi:MAG: DUF3343 domain-containing protein [Candidatus Zixiibacteriota bacterium]|jgi:hypothetical protein